MSSGHGHVDHHSNKGVALLISVLALVLAFSETLGKARRPPESPPTFEASNLVGVLPGEDDRQTTLRTAGRRACRRNSATRRRRG
jgi:hypothetical protein